MALIYAFFVTGLYTSLHRIEQDMDFNTTLGPTEFGPGEQVEAEGNSCRVKAEKFVFEAERALAIAKPACSTELLDHGPEEFLKKFCRTIFVGIGERGLVWGFANAEVFEFPLAAGQTATNLPKGVGTGKVTKEHCHQLGPAGKSLRFALRLVLGDQMRKFGSGKVMKQLTKQTRYLYHGSALCGNCDEKFVGAKILHHNSPGGHLFKSYFRQE